MLVGTPDRSVRDGWKGTLFCGLDVYKRQTQLGPIATNCYIVADEEKNAAVVDPGAEAARVKKILDDHQLRLRAVLLTHGHFDHIGGIKGLIEAFPDAEVVIGEMCIRDRHQSDHES